MIKAYLQITMFIADANRAAAAGGLYKIQGAVFKRHRGREIKGAFGA